MAEARSAEELVERHEERVHEQIANLRHLAIRSHDRIIEKIGGARGVRDEGALDSAVSVPFASFFGEDLHETVFAKAASLMRSLSLDHPFNDGNKRTSLVITAAFLFEHGIGFKESLTDEEIVDFCISLAKGEKEVDEISSWLQANTDGASARSFRNVMEQLQTV